MRGKALERTSRTAVTPECVNRESGTSRLDSRLGHAGMTNLSLEVFLRRLLTTLTLLLVVWSIQAYSQAKKYYVDATGGSDANNGLSSLTPWKTIARVNATSFGPGDTILFKGGETFRGSLVPSSGSTAGYVTYSSYGKWVKPKLLGAYDRSSASDWTDQGGNIWRTSNRSVGVLGSELLPNPDFSTDLSSWDKYDDPAGNTVSTFSRATKPGEYFTAPAGGRLTFAVSGKTSSSVQFFTTRWPVSALKWYRFSFKAKATRPFTIPADKIVLHKDGPPWTRYSSSFSGPVSITSQWTSNDLYFYATSTAVDSRITFYFTDFMANGDTLYIDALSFKECDADPERLAVDVGNVILNNEKGCGTKVWERSDLNAQGKFWYDEDNDLLEMYSTANPGSYYSHLELGLNIRCVDVNNRRYVVCDNLDLRYGVFGVDGINTDHIVVRNCDISYIGGADQYGGSATVRFGNGVQFWNAAHDNIVEACKLDQIYDTGLTVQGTDSAGYEVYNIYFRNNLINNCENSYEFWAGGERSIAHDIYFENNTCLNPGKGWGRSQRPNPNGVQVMISPVFAKSWNVFIRNNVFYEAVDYGIRWWWMEDTKHVMLDNNCWYQSNGALSRIDNSSSWQPVNTIYDYSQWDTYRAVTKQDSNSIHADPLLNADFSLQASSPCIDAGKALATVQKDFSGTLRPQGSGYDIGAFEAPASLIASPLLLIPADNTKRMSIAPVLTWAKTRRATKYHLVVSLSPDFSGLAVVDSTTADTTLSIGPLQYGTIYYWRVQAASNVGTSGWSQTRSFATIAAAPLGQAYYVAPNGNDSNPGTELLPWKTFAKATSMATPGVTVFIKQGIYRERLVPVNSGTVDRPITFTSYPGDSVIISGVGVRLPSEQYSDRWWNGLIHIENLTNIKLSGLRVVNSTASGILATNCSHITIERNYTDSTFSPGIVVNGCSDVVVEANEVVHGCTGGDQECISFMSTNQFEIRNNRVHDGMTEGIDVKVGSSNGIVTKNEVYNQIYRIGIYIEGWDRHEFNIEVFDNVSHHNVDGFAVSTEDGGLTDAIKMHHNHAFKNQYSGFRIVGWGAAGKEHPVRNLKIYENTLNENAVGIELSGNTGTTLDSIDVFNNLIYRNKNAGVRISRYDGPTGDFAMRNIAVINNTICNNGTVGSGWDADNGGMNIFNVSPGNLVVRNNVFSNNAVCTIHIETDVPAGSVLVDYNFFDGFRNFRNETAGTNAVYGSPLFADTLRNDYHLQAASPCIDRGHPDPVYSDPVDRNRPGYALYPAQGTVRNDMGAYGGPYASSSDVVIIAAPSAPNLVAPADGAKSISVSPTLSWDRAMGAVSYRLQVSLNSWFSTTNVNDSAIAETFKSIGPLQTGTTYYWRVSAKNEGGTSAWSQVRSFTTSVATPLGTAYYVSPTGDDSNPGTEVLPWKTLAKATAVATSGVTVFIKQGVYRERLLPVTSGTADAPITFTSYPGDSATITGAGMTPLADGWSGLIWMQDLRYIKISGLRVTNSENICIDIENSSHVTIEKNFIDSSVAPGIKVYGSDNIVIDANEVAHGCMREDLEECISVGKTNLLEIKNNRVHDGGAIGIDVKYGSSNAIVTKNEVYNQRGAIGIYIEAWLLHQFNIDVFDNISHDNGIGFAVTSETGGLNEGIRIHNNKAYRNSDRGFWVGGWGIGATHPVKNVKLYGNESYENSFGFEIGVYTGSTLDSIEVVNNQIYRNKGVGVRITRYDGPSGSYVMRNVSIINNTIYHNGTIGKGWDADNGGVNIFNVAPENLIIRNNILSNNAVCTIYRSPEVPAGSVTIDYNLIDGFRNFVNETAGTNEVSGSPLFVDSLRNDYHLQANSPCIDRGNPNQAYNDPADLNKPGYALYPAQGATRNDIGAFGGPYADAGDLSTCVAKPQIPALSSPADSARGISLAPTLTWGGILGTDRYRVQLSTSANFGNKVIDDSLETDCYRQVGPLQNSTTYYWRVSATNVGGTSSYSAIRTFTTVGAAPGAPILAGPPDSTKNVQLTPTLSWIAAQGASLYHLQVSTASNFGSRVVDDSTISSISMSVGPLTLATTYFWRVRAKNEGGWSPFSSSRQFTTVRTTSVERLSSEIPTVYSLSQNYPNPFNPSTRIRFGIPKTGRVALKIFDLLGRELETLVAEELAPAYYEAVWKANVASGIYFYMIRAGDFIETKKMILLR